MIMKNNSKKTALITGATSGIGYELARIFARNGFNLVIVARNRKNLKTTSDDLSRINGVRVDAISMDLSIPKSSQDLFNELKKRRISIDVLVNNAGFGTYGAFYSTDISEEKDLISLNITTPVMLMKIALRDMVKKNDGKILNIGSMASFQPGPFMANYSASKSYILSLTEAVAAELHGTRVTVSVLCPGVVLTGFQKRAGNTGARINKGSHMDAETVARIGYNGLMKGKVVIIPEFKTKILTKLNRLFPRSLVRFIVRKMMEP